MHKEAKSEEFLDVGKTFWRGCPPQRTKQTFWIRQWMLIGFDQRKKRTWRRRRCDWRCMQPVFFSPEHGGRRRRLRLIGIAAFLTPLPLCGTLVSAGDVHESHTAADSHTLYAFRDSLYSTYTYKEDAKHTAHSHASYIVHMYPHQ